MKIQKINIAEFKVIKDLDKDINGANIMLIGENGVGKSSLIQFIEIALGKSTNIPAEAKGKGYVIADKNGKKFCFKVKIEDGKSKVTIETDDGLSDNRKSTLAGIVGAMDFDIDEFVELSKTTAGRKKQVEIFKSFLPKEFQQELLRYEANVKAAYDERTEIGRNKKQVEGAIRESKLNVLTDSDLRLMKEVDTAELTKELSAINEHNRKISDVKTRCHQRQNEIDSSIKDISDLNKQIEEIKMKIDIKTKQQRNNLEMNIQAEKWLKENQEKETAEINKQLSEAGEINRKAIAAKELLKQKELLSKLIDEDGDMTAKIEGQRQAIADAIRDQDTPVQGLSFEGEELKYNGIIVSPDTLSTSEIMELGIKLKMAENPDLGVLFIQRGESLGKKRLAEIMELANKNDWQIIMEQVQRGEEKLKIELIKL